MLNQALLQKLFQQKQNRDVNVTLTFDEVSIWKKVELNGNKFVGFIDLWTGIEA